MSSLKSEWFAVLVAGALAVAAAALSIAYRDLWVDDAYITYRVAHNIVAGLGPVYNAGERVQVSTTPLYSIVLALVGLIAGSANIPTVSTVVSGASLFLAAFFLYLFTRSGAGSVAGVLAAAFLIAWPLLLMALGMETAFYLMLALGAIYFYTRGHLTVAAIALALAALTRTDGILLAGLVLAHQFLLRRRVPPLSIAVFFGLLVPWFAFAWLYYGSPLPLTLGAKMAHGQGSWWPTHFLGGALQQARTYHDADWGYLLFLVFGLVGLAAAVKWWKWASLPVAWALLHGTAYELLGVPNYHWYYAPVVPALAMLAGSGLALPARLLAGRFQTPDRLRLETLLALGLVAMPAYFMVRAEVSTDLQTASALPFVKDNLYREVGTWMRNNTPEDASLAAVEIGLIGYYSQRRVVDVVGLAQPTVAAQFSKGDYSYAIRAYAPEYVILPGDVLGDMQHATWFASEYIPTHYFPDERFDMHHVVLFAKSARTRAVATVPHNTGVGNDLTLTGYSVDSRSVLPGANVRIALDLNRRMPSAEELGFFVHLLDMQGKPAARVDFVPIATDVPTGAFRQYLDLYIPDQVPRGVYELDVGLFSPQTLVRVPTQEEGSPETTDRLHLGRVRVGAISSPAAVPSIPLAATIGDSFGLQGYDLERRTTSQGIETLVRLYWRSRLETQQDYTVFVQLLDGQGDLVGQHDGPPERGKYPTSAWRVGEDVLDEHVVRLST